MDRKTTAAALLVAATAGLLGGAVPRLFTKPPVEASGFVLLDESGRKRAELFIDRDGKARLSLLDESGRVTWSAPPAPHFMPLAPPAR